MIFQMLLRISGLAILVIFVVLILAKPLHAFGPFPVGTTVFVDVNNTTGNEDGSQGHPFNTIQEGINGAGNGDTVGVAAGTYNESITLATGIKVIGVDPKTVIIDGGNDEGDVVQMINVTNVRVSRFTIRGAIADGHLPGGAGIFVNFPDSTILIDHNILTGNDYGIGVFNAYLAQSGGPAIDSNQILKNNVDGISMGGYGPITNNIIANNRLGIYASGTSVPCEIVNNTIVNNKDAGIWTWNDVSLTITNNVLSHNGGFGIDVVSANNPTTVRPYVTYNLFFNNGAGNFSDIDPPIGNNATLNSAAQINSLSQNSHNLVGNPQFTNLAGNDYHLTNTSPALDAGTNLNAPTKDFDGNQRPKDGDGDCSASTDIGAYEAPAPRTIALCRQNFDIPEKWIQAGCEIIDCCPMCPLASLLEWIIRVDGDPVSEIILRFNNLPRTMANRLRIEGNAKWLDDSRLMIFGIGQIKIYGLRFSKRDADLSKTNARVTVESVSILRTPVTSQSNSSLTREQTRFLRLSVDELIVGRIIDRDILEYEYK